MLLPYLKEVQNKSKKYSVVFRGINYGEGTQDGEFAETHNLSTDQYPCITQRAVRTKTVGYTKTPTTLHIKDGKQLVIVNKRVLYNNTELGEVTDGKKQLATIGDYIVIFPDKKYVKVPSEEDENQNVEFGNLEEEFNTTSTQTSWLEFEPSSITIGTEFKITDPFFGSWEISKDGANFPFRIGDIVTIKGSNSTDNDKTDITIVDVTPDSLTFDKNTVRFTSGTQSGELTISRKSDAIFPFKKGDAVTIKGCSSEGGNNKTEEILITEKTDTKLTFSDNTFAKAIENGDITIKRSVPDLDFICESNYRLWGTHGNTIYSSKFSDPFNFKVFEGLATDSYAIDVGSEGAFTGCIPYASHICFFKENTLHKLYGTKPSNFQVTTVNVYGVQSGSERSMHIVNEQLLYKGVGGVYSYTGGVPELISQKFGNRRYSDAVACCDGEKYYISMKQGNTWNMFTYDVARNIWLREDDTHAVDMAFHNGKVYYIDNDLKSIYYIDKDADRSDIEWSATLCTLHETMNERKGYSKFHLRMDMSAGAWLAVDVKTDNDTQWQQVYTTHNEKAKTVSIPIMPTRCDSIDIRLRGKGKCTIKTFIREFTVGSDV